MKLLRCLFTFFVMTTCFLATADSTDVSCYLEDKYVKCYNNRQVFIFNESFDPRVAEYILSLYPEESRLNFPKHLDMNALLIEQTVFNSVPDENGWKLPEITLMKLKRQGIHKIQGVTVDQLLYSTKNIRWKEFNGHDQQNRYSDHRITGRYNALFSSVMYTESDLQKQQLQDLEIFGLHELFGINQINDHNYFQSILLSMYLNEEISSMQYNNILTQTNLVHGRTHSLLDRFQLSEGDDNGGITGVEGGGDIVAASIKKMIVSQILSKNKKLNFNEISDLLKFDIAYQSPLFFNPSTSIPLYLPIKFVPKEDRRGYRTYSFITEHYDVLVIGLALRNRWHELGYEEKLSKINEMIEIMKNPKKDYPL